MITRSRSRACGTALLGLLAAACAPDASPARRAGAAVDEFHALYNQRSFRQIYASASDTLRKITPEETFVQGMTRVSRELGRVESAERTASTVVAGRKQSRVVLWYRTRFEKGTKAEMFSYVLDGRALRLERYEVAHRQPRTR
jgi:hypothetical protein